MIKVKLKEVIEQQGITLTDIHQATGISKNTLSLISTGSSKGIQFDTLDKLLSYLKIDISELIEHRDDYSYDLSEFVIDYAKKIVTTSILMKYRDVDGKSEFPFKVKFEHIEQATSFLFFNDNHWDDTTDTIMSLITNESEISPQSLQDHILSNLKKDNPDVKSIKKYQDAVFEQFMLKFSFNFSFSISRDSKKNQIAQFWNEHGSSLDEVYIFNWLVPIKKLQENNKEFFNNYSNTKKIPAVTTSISGSMIGDFLTSYISTSQN